MFKNYITTALRNIKRQKFYSFINILGLSVGFTIFIIAAALYSFNLNYDTFHKDSDRIYLVSSERSTADGIKQKDAYTNLPTASLMVQHFPEIEQGVTLQEFFRQVFRYKNTVLYERHVIFTEPNFLKVFNYLVIKGDDRTPLDKPNSVVLTERAAVKYFGKEEPIGKMLETDFSDMPLVVTAVIEDCPANSCMKFDILVSLPENYTQNWNVAGSIYSFVKVKPGVDVKELETKFPQFMYENIPGAEEKNVMLSLFPMQDIHLKSLDMNSGFDIAPMFQFYLILGIAVALLLIVIINFTVLTTSHYINRAKEVGIRKVVGAAKWQLIQQYIGESMLMALMALPVAIILFEIISPAFEAMLGGMVELNLWSNPLLLLIIFSTAMLVGFASGIYPAFYLSAIKPAHALKSKYVGKASKFNVRKGLVVFQFVLAFVMIVVTLAFTRQMDMLAIADLGYNRENIISILSNDELYKKFDVLERELKQNSNISIVASAHNLPFSWGRQDKMRPEGVSEKESENISSYPCGYNFIEALQMKIVEGRSFSREFNDDNSIIISEETAKHFGWNDPIGKVLILEERGNARKTVIGVVKDFHFPHVFFEKAPAVIFFRPQEPFYIFVKTVSAPDERTVQYVKNVWNKVVPDIPFEYSILDYSFEENLHLTTKVVEIFKYISIISVFIACLGLFALASYTVERRTKEIGVRKVLGASVNKITGMLVTEFIKLVVISNIIALPFAYYLSQYVIHAGWVYKTDLTVTLFAVSFILSIVSSLLAVGFQSLKAAMSNPISALRYE